MSGMLGNHKEVKSMKVRGLGEFQNQIFESQDAP